MKIEEISNKDLFRIAMNRLWIRYDLGGISVGRSYQAAILESILHLFEGEDLQREVEGDFATEIRRRQINSFQVPVQRTLLFCELSTLSNPELAFVAFTELNRWYREDAKRFGFLNVDHPNWVKCIRSLCVLAYPEISMKRVFSVRFTRTQLIREGESRRDREIKYAARHQEFADFGINPWTDSISKTS